MRKLLLMAASAPLALHAPTAAAQSVAQDPAQDAAAAIDLPEIDVGGGLTPVAEQSYARAATIITGAELEARQVRTFSDALRQAPGVSVSRLGGPGGQTQIRIRGAEANHTLVLIDGAPTADPASGVDFSHITPDQIERIEVLRGPQSALYGAGATAGVVNIVTKAGVRGGSRVTVSGRGSTAPGGAASLLLQGGTDAADIGFGLSYRDDEGWDVSGEDGEKDGARDLTLNLRGSADIAADVTARGSLRFVDRSSEFDDSNFGCGGPECYVSDASGRRSEGQDVYLRGAVDWTMFDGALTHTPSLAYTSSETDTYDAFGFSYSDAAAFDARYQAAYAFGPGDAHTLVGAVQYRNETFENSYAGGDTKERDQIGYVLDYRGQITDALFVQGGLRYDDNSDFEDFVSWSASASYRIAETDTRLRASIGEAQTNPTFFELYGFVPGQFVGNPGLKPERNFGWDIGVDQGFWGARGLLSVTYFNETLEDEISGSGLTVTNLDGDSDRQGVEVGLSLAPVEGLTVGVSYTYLDAAQSDGLQETRRPHHAAGANILYRFLGDRASVGLDLTYTGETVQRDFGDASFASPRVDVDDYFVVDVTASYRIAAEVEAFGGVKNLFDAEYEDVLGYREQPLTGFLGLRATF